MIQRESLTWNQKPIGLDQGVLYKRTPWLDRTGKHVYVRDERQCPIISRLLYLWATLRIRSIHPRLRTRLDVCYDGSVMGVRLQPPWLKLFVQTKDVVSLYIYNFFGPNEVKTPIDFGWFC